ncbi:MAG: GNAT family N-acetyltransferase [archaeon]|jgi:ribosomal protein S18 acetylase RimI-like enzyme
MKVKLKDKTFTYRFAKEEDIDKINRFDINIYKQVDHRFYFRHNKIKLKNMMSNGRKLWLVFYGKRLVAWAGIVLDMDKTWASDYNLSEKQMAQVGDMVATAVSPKFRGYGLQRFLIEKRIEYLKKIKKKYVVTDVNPENKISENNIIACGFKFTKKAKSRRRASKVMLNHYILKI